MTIKQAKELAKGTLPEPSESGLLKWQAEHGTFDDFEPQKVTGVQRSRVRVVSYLQHSLWSQMISC